MSLLIFVVEPALRPGGGGGEGGEEERLIPWRNSGEYSSWNRWSCSAFDSGNPRVKDA